MALKPNADLSRLDRRELCEFASELCAKVEAEVGQMAYRGGIFEGNVSIDENGEVRLGSVPEGEPSGQELLYAAPELYWHGKYTPACDVYSIGLLLYKLSEGRLPFESDDCDEKRAHKLRLQGSSFNHPGNAGRRLGDIIARALSYDPADRYRNPGEMKIMLDNCLKNLFLREEPCAEAVFRKNDDDLSEMERMMVSIIENHSDFEENAGAGEVDEAAAVVGPLFDEAPKEESGTAEEMSPEPDAEESVPAAEKEIAPEVPDGFDEEPEETVFRDEYVPAEETYADAADGEPEPAEPEAQPVVRLEPAEADPELEPVHVKGGKNKQDDFPDIIVTNTGRTVQASRREVEAEVRRRRRRPLIFILVLCALLIFAALLFNKIMGPAPSIPESEETEEVPVPVVVTTAPVVETTPEPEITEPVEMVSEYRFFAENVSWTEARARCQEEGGHLVVINDADEMARVVEMAQERGIHVVWIGLHRESGMLVWETEDLNAEFYYNWDQGEPSEFDGETPEDYVFLWDWTGRGWVYNDCINDPAGEFQAYWNQIGFVCEIERPKE